MKFFREEMKEFILLTSPFCCNCSAGRQGDETAAVWRPGQVWLRAEEQPEEKTLRHSGPEVGQEGDHLQVTIREKLPVIFFFYVLPSQRDC